MPEVSEFNGIKVANCQLCGGRDAIHLEILENAPHRKRVVCRHCQNDAPYSDEIHAAILLWNRMQEELKLQLDLFTGAEV